VTRGAGTRGAGWCLMAREGAQHREERGRVTQRIPFRCTSSSPSDCRRAGQGRRGEVNYTAEGGRREGRGSLIIELGEHALHLEAEDHRRWGWYTFRSQEREQCWRQQEFGGKEVEFGSPGSKISER
jgi:hypothetical protein